MPGYTFGAGGVVVTSVFVTKPFHVTEGVRVNSIPYVPYGNYLCTFEVMSIGLIKLEAPHLNEVEACMCPGNRVSSTFVCDYVLHSCMCISSCNAVSGQGPSLECSTFSHYCIV